MNRRRWKGQICSMLIGILFCCVGCGLQQEKQDLETSQVATGAALCIEEDYHSEKIQHQLGLLVDHARKWRLAKDSRSAGMVRYAVTDLDRNGRLEIMVLKESETVDQLFLQNFFEVNASGDGIEEIETDPVGEVCLGEWYDELRELDYAYYDPKTGECHYVIGNELSEEEMLSDESEDYDKNIMALTLRQGKLSCDTLACQEQSKNQQGKMQSRFYQMDGTEKNEIDPSEYTVEKVGDAVYADCGKYSLQFSPFFFDHSLEDMTEKQMHHALEKSYRESFMGYPLGQQEKKVAGQKIRIPQYSTMQDGKKQKRINQIIVKQVEKILHRFDDAKGKRNVDISIKYAGGDKVSLLLQVSRPAPREQQKDTEFFEEVAQEGAIWDTINIDLEQGSLLAKQDLLQESVRQEVMEEVEMDLEDEMEEGYEESGKNQNSDHFYGNVLENLKKWQEISLYQSSDGIGFVIPTGLAMAPFAIYEMWNGWDETKWDGGVSFAEIDWKAYQYKMFASEYQDLQDYMPVLTGEAQFIFQWDEDEEEAVKGKNMTISDWVKEYVDEEATEDFVVNEVCNCDLTQDGKAELILEIWNAIHLILHKEGNTYYGTLKGRRSLYELQTNGVYGAGKGDYYYQMHFEKDRFVEEYLGGYEYPIQAEDFKEEDVKYYIRDQRVGKDAYEKWKKSIMTEEVSWYRPEALEKR